MTNMKSLILLAIACVQLGYALPTPAPAEQVPAWTYVSTSGPAKRAESVQDWYYRPTGNAKRAESVPDWTYVSSSGPAKRAESVQDWYYRPTGNAKREAAEAVPAW